MEERIQQIIEYYGLNPYAFEQKIFVSEGTISKFLAHKIGMKVTTLEKILGIFPDISPDWLLLGKGEMLRSDAPAAATQHAVGPSVVAYLEKIIADKDRELAQAYQTIGQLQQQVQHEREKFASLSVTMPTAPILP